MRPKLGKVKVEPKETIRVEDLVRGRILVNSDELEDKILIKSDGMPTYHFANVVDDHYMKISDVIRGEEWLPSLPIHKLLYNAFDWPLPKFIHLPLILNPLGKGKLSKRDGDIMGFPVYPLKWKNKKGFKEIGFLPESLMNYISLLGWNPGTEKEILNLKDIIDTFDISMIQKSGGKFDFEKAKWINHKHLAISDAKSILKRFPEFFNSKISQRPIKLLSQIYELVRDRLFLLKDFEKEAIMFFHDPIEYDLITLNKLGKDNTERILNLFVKLIKSDTPIEQWKEIAFSWKKSEKISVGIIMQSLRIAIVGKLNGPDIFKICSMIKKEVLLKRVEKLKIILND